MINMCNDKLIITKGIYSETKLHCNNKDTLTKYCANQQGFSFLTNTRHFLSEQFLMFFSKEPFTSHQ